MSSRPRHQIAKSEFGWAANFENCTQLGPRAISTSGSLTGANATSGPSGKLLGTRGCARDFLDVEDRIASVSLRKDDLTFAVLTDAVAVPDLGKKRFWIE